MKGKLLLGSWTAGLIFLASSLLTPVAFAQTASSVTSGPVSQYKFKASASWMMGKINLSYYNDGSADSFALLYGSKLGNYKFGAVNLPAAQFATNKFTVGYLASDRNYYFVLIAQKDGQFVYMTPPVTAITN